MATQKKSWSKNLLIVFLVLVVFAACIYWYVATEKFSDTSDRKAAFTVSAIDFIREFRKDDSLANQKYREKIVTVNGRISELESPDSATVNVKIIDTTTGDYAIFAFQEQHLDEAKTLKTGDSISIKGSCSGVSYSEILDLYYIPFKRSALNN
jgi:uncharacterized membrane protein